MDRINTVSGLTLDFERIKTIRTDSEFLIVDYNNRIEYSKNPFTGEVEKTQISDSVSREFSSFETARNHQIAITDYWNDYLTSKL